MVAVELNGEDALIDREPHFACLHTVGRVFPYQQ